MNRGVPPLRNILENQQKESEEQIQAYEELQIQNVMKNSAINTLMGIRSKGQVYR
jgi:hypothetical protein